MGPFGDQSFRYGISDDLKTCQSRSYPLSQMWTSMFYEGFMFDLSKFRVTETSFRCLSLVAMTIMKTGAFGQRAHGKLLHIRYKDFYLGF